MKRALVTQTRYPEIDRDRGSQRVDAFMQTLADDGWAVTFLASETDGDPRHRDRLRQRGIATFQGVDEAADVIDHGDFELAVLAFWKPSSRLIPILRSRSPRTRIIVDSIDIHFLRDARRQFGVSGHLDDHLGQQLTSELNTYRSADAVLTVSQVESDLLAAFLGDGKAVDVPLAEPVCRASTPFADRAGMFFVGNFRHLPNGEAVEYLCKDILPRVDPRVLAEHPAYIAGSRLDDKVRAHGRGLPHTRMVGWIPSIAPYLERTRVCAVPLLHGAGVKGKVLESLMAGTPVVTTPIGAEGLGLVHDEHALIADTPSDFAAALTRVLTDDATWQRLADAGHQHVCRTHDPDAVADRFRRVVADVLARPAQTDGDDQFRYGRRRAAAYDETIEALTATLAAVTDPGAVVSVVSRGDDKLVTVDGRAACHFPAAADGRWAGFHPADDAAAIAELERARELGSRYLAFPSTSFWWLHHYSGLTAHLDMHHRRIRSDEHVVLYDLAVRTPRSRSAGAAGATPSADAELPVLAVVGTYGANQSGPPPALAAELAHSVRYRVVQHWQPLDPGAPRAATGADGEPPDDATWVVRLDDSVVLPAGFVDDFFELADALAELGVERVQPAHTNGPSAGPPVTEAMRGVIGREVAGATPLPLFARRAGATDSGPVTLVDRAPIGLARPIGGGGDPLRYSNVLDVFTAGDDGAPRRAVRRGLSSPDPLVSVLVATYDRPDLLAGCLRSLTEQSLARSDFEVIVVDDGSPPDAAKRTVRLLTRLADELPLTRVRIDHGGRSAAKNLAVLLARADVVMFLDDDDRAERDMLSEHLAGHEAHPDETSAVLGFTGWAPELTVTPLMHYLTDVDKMLFAYGNLDEAKALDWRGFWEGRLSSKRALHVRHGLHDQRLDYSIDVELAWRLAPRGLTVHYHPAARSVMARPIDFDTFCRRFEAKGRAQAAIAALHDDPTLRSYTGVDNAVDHWERAQAGLSDDIALVGRLEAADLSDPDTLHQLHRAYRRVFQALNAKGVVDAAGRRPVSTESTQPTQSTRPTQPTRPTPVSTPRPGGRPRLTVTVPVWSHTPELADVAAATIERVWDVAGVETEVLVIDNGSPFQSPLRATVHRFDENRGVAAGWNAGIARASAPVIAVLNSDCLVEPGWDEALYEAATSGRRVAFPYTDHGDGEGFRRPDQAGTAGWCFMASAELFAEIGPFDERFSPAFGEDTDYWHRCWEAGVELTPVPAARVSHERRTTAGRDERTEWLLIAHRYLYGWKHNVEPMRAPPYYRRDIVEYASSRPAGNLLG